MEKKILYSNPRYAQKLDDFKYASVEKQRYLVYSNKLNENQSVIKYETEEKLCYFLEVAKPRFGQKGFVQRTTKNGITFDKTKRKLSIWFGIKPLRMSPIFITVMMTDIGALWYSTMPKVLQWVAARMLWEKIFKGLIKSPASYSDSYVKYHLKIKEVDLLSYYSMITTKNPRSIHSFNLALRFSIDPNKTLNNYDLVDANLNDYRSSSIFDNCKILGKKIDWSLPIDRLLSAKEEMDKEIAKLDKEYNRLQEFYGYLEPYDEYSIKKKLKEQEELNLPF